ncbi:MAG: hypothetical protein KatS3mg031_0055 [Chitinophagales bacterium]|nr:MAG: hypothetical protein KatS3mg031_0055 [Chitinophagales bacterium]
MNKQVMKKKAIGIWSFLAVLLWSGHVYASHAVGIDLSYQCLGNNQYVFTLNFYRDCEGVDAPSSAGITVSSASCGVNTTVNLPLQSASEVSPLCLLQIQNSTCNGGSLPGIEHYVYSGTFTLPLECADWVISYSLCCRNYAITNLDDPGSRNIYAEARINNTQGLCNSSPTFTTLPVPYLCTNQVFNYNHGAVDIDGDSLYYRQISTLEGPGQNIPYTGNYSPTNPMSTTGGFNFNNSTGQMSFTASTTQQPVITIIVEEYRNGVLIGSTMRDLQLVVLNCNNTIPAVSGINGTNMFSIDVCTGYPLCFDVFSIDPDAGQNVTIQWNGGIAGATFTTSGSPLQNGTFCWTPQFSDVGSHTFTVQVKDDACPIPGTNTYVFTINVIPNPNPPVDAGPSVQICQGSSTQLNATGPPNVVSYRWIPTTGLSNPNIPDPVASPLVTTTYRVIALYADSCASADTVTVIVNPVPLIEVFPRNVTICPGSSIQLSASATTGSAITWSNNTTGPINVVTPVASGEVFVATATNVYGCSASDSATVEYAPPPPPQVCNNIYVTPAGTGSGLTPSDPTDLLTAVSLAQCNNLTIKMAIGTYTISNPLTITSNLTIEGGFDDANNWVKTSLAGATTIYRDTSNPEGLPLAPRLVALYANSASYIRLQDLTIQVADAPPAPVGLPGTTTYGLHLTNCSEYDIVRCQILAGQGGDGGQGPPGSPGAAGANGSNATGQSGAPGAGGGGNGGRGGDAGGVFSSGDDGNNGSPGVPGGAAGGSGGNGACGLAFCGLFSSPSDGGNGQNGGPGAVGSPGAPGSPGIFSLGFFVPGPAAGSGTPGTNGNPGGGGGGGGGIGCLFDSDEGGGGGGGGAGGQGGQGGGGGYGGGGSFGVYLFNNGINGKIVDCFVSSSAAGNGGVGGPGGPGGLGGQGGLGYDADCGGNGGRGGNGGPGGAGGPGGDGAPGIAGSLQADPVTPGNVLAISNTTFNLSAQPVIQAENITCARTDMDFTAAASATWDFGQDAVPQASTGAIVTTQFTTIGRKDVTYGSDTYTGFVHIAIDNTTFLPEITVSGATVVGPDEYRVCQGDSIDFSSPTPAVSFNWDMGGSAVPNNPTGAIVNNVVFTAPGRYVVKLTVTTDCCGQSNPDSVIVHVDPRPEVVLTGDSLICRGEEATFILSGADYYEWQPEVGSILVPVDTITVSPLSTTSYLIIGYNANGSCTDAYYFTVGIYDPPELDVTATDASCSSNQDGSATVIPLSGGPSFSYQWNDSLMQTTPTAFNLAPGRYSVTVTDDVTGCWSDTSILVGNRGVFAYIRSSTNVSCYGGSDGTAVAAATGGDPPFTYQWDFNNSTDSAITGLSAGVYTVTVTDAEECQSVATAYIFEPDSLLLNVYALDSVCFEPGAGVAVAQADGGAGSYAYAWSAQNVGDTTVAQGLSTGVYYLTVTDANGCQIVDSVSVTTGPLTIDAAATPPVIGQGESTTLSVSIISGGSGSYVYSWEPAGPQYLNDPTSATPVATPPENMTYYVTVTDVNTLCTATDSVYVVAQTSYSIPDAFTPNGDAHNPTFRVYLYGVAELQDFRIYNRWGEQVYNSTDPTGWDGTYKGKEQPMGTYVYYAVIKLKDEVVKVSGAFSLIR